MSIIRPDASQILSRFRDALIGAGIMLLGLWWAWGSLGLIKWMGVALAILGAGLTWAGIQRGRVLPRKGGAGVIELDEGQLTYLHPDGGAIVPLESVIRIEIETTDDGPLEDDLFWLFHLLGGTIVRIPGSAVGADFLFDALAGFSGANYEQVIAASGSTAQHVFVIWQKPPTKLH